MKGWLTYEEIEALPLGALVTDDLGRRWTRGVPQQIPFLHDWFNDRQPETAVVTSAQLAEACEPADLKAVRFGWWE